MLYINIRFAQSTTQTLIEGELKTTLAFINVSASCRCGVNKLPAHLTLGRFTVKRFVGNFVLLCIGLKSLRQCRFKKVLQYKVELTYMWNPCKDFDVQSSDGCKGVEVRYVM